MSTTVAPPAQNWTSSQTVRSSLRQTLGQLLRRHRGAVFLTYLLLVAENLLRLLQPFLLGIAVNDLLSQRSTGLWSFLIGHAALMSVQYIRQRYDTRVFSRMYAEQATEMVLLQRAAQVPASRIVARASLSRQLTGFIEQEVPRSVSALFSCVGALLMIGYYQGMLVLGCLLIAIPVLILNWFYHRHVAQVSREMHDHWEEEVDLIRDGDSAQITRHYQQLTRCWVKISDLEARTTGGTEFFVLALLAVSLVSVCQIPDILPGDIFAVFRYLMMFIMGIDAVPRLVEQLARLRDISHRLTLSPIDIDSDNQ